jgi:manganese/iron transport system permease protein
VNVATLLTAPLGYDFFVRALIAAVVVGIVCALVGSYLILRGLAFMSDAISHAAFPGVVAAYLVHGPFYVGAAIAAVATSLGIGWISRRSRLRPDTAIGVLFSGMFALGVVLFSLIPNYVGDLFGFLFGEILAISPSDLVSLLLLALVVMATVTLLWKELLYATFDPLGAEAAGLPVRRLDDVFLVVVALTIVVSLQAVGIVLVVAMLVTPAATAQLAAAGFRRMVGVAIAIGIACPIVGLYLSYWLDVPSGATIVLVESLLFLATLAVRLTRGARRPPPGDPAGSPVARADTPTSGRTRRTAGTRS